MSSRRPSSFSKSSNSSSSLSSPTTSPISRVPRTNSNGTPRRVTLVEPEKPTKHEQLSEEPCKSKRKKALKVVVDGVSIVAHLLCMCCVLSGEQRPKNGAYYAHYDHGHTASISIATLGLLGGFENLRCSGAGHTHIRHGSLHGMRQIFLLFRSFRSFRYFLVFSFIIIIIDMAI
ncbi:hypothetical protein FPQ18DRAFT_89805 [Pyronema domesticum]|nr:hypothetical protein FPQ18DRAFT_89805 [Pyronema domesticum]